MVIDGEDECRGCAAHTRQSWAPRGEREHLRRGSTGPVSEAMEGGGERDIQPDHDLCSEGEDTSALLLLLLRTIPRSSSVRSPIALQKASTV